MVFHEDPLLHTTSIYQQILISFNISQIQIFTPKVEFLPDQADMLGYKYIIPKFFYWFFMEILTWPKKNWAKKLKSPHPKLCVELGHMNLVVGHRHPLVHEEAAPAHHVEGLEVKDDLGQDPLVAGCGPRVGVAPVHHWLRNIRKHLG